MKMKAVIATDSISLRSRKMLLTFECPQDILINRSRYTIMFGVILRIIIIYKPIAL